MTKGIEVKLLKPFPIIRETLDRIGIANRAERVLFPSCYVFENEGKSFIAHFKELLKEPCLEETDYERRNTIIWLLANWNLIEVVDEGIFKDLSTNIMKKKIYVLSKHQMLDEKWEIRHKLHQFGINQSTKIGN